MKKSALPILLVFALTCCNKAKVEFGNDCIMYSNNKNTFQAGLFIEKIRKFEEIKKLENQMQVPFTYLVKQTPTNEEPRFLIQVCVNEEYRYRAILSYLAYPSDQTIWHLDTTNPTLLCR